MYALNAAIGLAIQRMRRRPPSVWSAEVRGGGGTAPRAAPSLLVVLSNLLEHVYTYGARNGHT